ncbi:MAG: DNA-processing protein DprA [bacterium]
MVRSFYPIVAVLLSGRLGPVDCFKLPRDVADTFEKLHSPAGRRELSWRLRKPVPDINWDDFQRQIDAIDRHGVGVVTFLDRGFPQYLRDIPKSPPILFYKGDIGVLDRRGVAVVGSRRPSARGAAFTRMLTGELGARGILVTSGAAKGIDTAAHLGALSAGAATAGVVGTGLDIAYPAENAGLLETISRDGCVLSEQLMGTPPLRHVFPLRNRLISGISHVVVVVEAGERSGALITATWALEQGRDVGAVPGFPGDARSRGTNALLKMGAFAVEGVDDILEAVPTLTAAARPRADARADDGIAGPAAAALGAQAQAVFEALGSSPVDCDTVARHAGLPAAAVQRTLLELELKGMIARDASGFYYRI